MLAPAGLVHPPGPWNTLEGGYRRGQCIIRERFGATGVRGAGGGGDGGVGEKGSKNRRKAVVRLARQHARVKAVRQDFLHKLTRKLVATYSRIGLEDLNVRGMQRGLLSRSVGDLGFYEFRRQVTYKADETGTVVVFAGRFYPSSKTCHRCGRVRGELDLKTRVLWCVCGEMIDRDHNAALNLEKIGRGSPEFTRTETGDQARRKPSRCRSKKCECP